VRRAVVLLVAGTALALAFVLALGGVGDDPNKLTNWQALVLGVSRVPPSSCRSRLRDT